MSNTIVNAHKTEIEELPSWLRQILGRHEQLNHQYQVAYSQFASAWNEFLANIDEINYEHGTHFNALKAMKDFKGREVTIVEEDNDEDESED